MDRKTSLASSGDRPHPVSDPEWCSALQWLAQGHCLDWAPEVICSLPPLMRELEHPSGLSLSVLGKSFGLVMACCNLSRCAEGHTWGWRWGAMWSSSWSCSPHTHSPVKYNVMKWRLWLDTRPEHIIICYQVWQVMTCYMGRAPGSDKWGIISLHLIDSELRAFCSLQDLNQWPKSERLFFPC